jgi:hypothetical protein
MKRMVKAGNHHPVSIVAIVAFGLMSTTAVAQSDASLRAVANALLAIDQHRATVIDRIVSLWGDSIAPSGAPADRTQLRIMLAALRADELLAASLAGTAEGVRDVLSSAQVSVPKAGDQQAQTKALGETADDVVYTPVTPCRLVETRGTFAAVYQGGGAFSGGTTRTYTVQGGNGVCLAQLPAGLSPTAVQLQVFGIPINIGASGDIEILPQGSTFGTTATEVYVGNVAFNTVSTVAKVNLANNQIAVQVRGGGANLAMDVVGYFKRPGNYEGTHTIAGVDATDSGGLNNTSSANYTTVGGGSFNAATGDWSVVAGGETNTASNVDSTVGGGVQNRASGDSSTVSGGFTNTASGTASTVSGGFGNFANGPGSTVPGGNGNVAHGENAFAAGTSARALSLGEFVWADATNQVFNPENAPHGWGDGHAGNTFNARVTGGVWFVTGVDTFLQPTTSVFVNPGSGTWSSTSDRAVKENFRSIDPGQMLAKVAAMPIESWNYISEGAQVRHVGPVSQDFWAAFRLGPNDTTITNVDESGVALAAIQALHQLMQQKDAEINGLKRELEAIKARIGM